MVQNLKKKNSLKQYHEGHLIGQRNVLNAKICVVGAKNHIFFTRMVKIGQNWAAKFRHLGGWGGSGGVPPPPLYPSLQDMHWFSPVDSCLSRWRFTCDR